VNVLEALKITTSKRWSKYDVSTINYKRIQIQEIKYPLISFDGDIIFVLPPLLTRVPSAYGCGMDDMDKLYNGHELIFN
jgi:hypothetical protein